MKKFLSFMLTLLTVLTLGATFHANAATGDNTYSHVFVKDELTDNKTLKTSATLGAQTWNITYDAAPTDKPIYVGWDTNKDTVAARGIQIGKSKHPAKSLSLKTTFTDVIKGVEVESSGASDIIATLEFLVDGNRIGEVFNLTNSNKAYAVNEITTGKELEIRYTNTSTKGMYIKSIKVITGSVVPTFDLTYDYGYTVEGQTENKNVVKQEQNKQVTEFEVPTREGFEFLGWFIGDVKYDSTNPLTMDSNKTLVAHWRELAKYTVKFNNNDGTDGSYSETVFEGQEVDYHYVKPAADKIFVGWFDALEGGNKIEFPYTPTKNIDLYARWTTKKVFKVQLISDGTVFKELTQDENNYLTLSSVEEPTKDGYKFLGWSEQAYFGKIVDKIKVTDNITLYAQWGSAVSSELHLTAKSMGLSNAYANNEGVKTYDGIDYNIHNVSNQGSFQIKDSGYIGNKTPYNLDIKTINLTLADGVDPATFEVYYSNTEITDITKATKAEGLNGMFVVPSGNKYFMVHESIKSSKRINNIDIEFDFEPTNISNVDTQSKIVMNYNSETKAANYIQLKFGTEVKSSLINANSTYGVIYLAADDIARINSLSGLNAAGLDTLISEGFAKQVNLIDNGDGTTKFSVNIANITPEKYNFNFVAFIYEKTEDGTVKLANGKKTSVNDTIETYLAMDATSQLVLDPVVKEIFTTLVK